MFTTGETLGLAEWLIDDTCLVFFIFHRASKKNPLRYRKILSNNLGITN